MDQLWQLIETRLTQECAQTSHSGVILDLKISVEALTQLRVALQLIVSVDGHRTEFDTPEFVPTSPKAAMPVKHWPGGSEFYSDRNYHE